MMRQISGVPLVFHSRLMRYKWSNGNEWNGAGSENDVNSVGMVSGIMGELSLLLPESLSPQIQRHLSHAAFAVAYDLSLIPIPQPSRATFQDGRLTIYHNFNESGHVLVPWKVNEKACRVLESASLCSHFHPYRLLVELARGELHQLREFVEDWTGIGVQLPESFHHSLREATRLFIAALTADEHHRQDQLSAVVLEQCSHLSDQLVREFSQQILEARLQQQGRLHTRLSAQTKEPWGPTQSFYLQSCNAAHLAVSWRQVEPAEGRWCWETWDHVLAEALEAAVPITAGPLIDLSREALPEWLLVHQGDWPVLAALMCDYVESVIQRYRHAIRRWIVISGFNLADPLGLEDDQRLRLAHRLLLAATHADPELEMGIRIAQPWGDYLSTQSSGLSPLVFVDDLLRSGLTLATLDLEIRFGPLPRASWPRDLLDLVRLLELYAIFGIPLSVTLAVPAHGPLAPETLASSQLPLTCLQLESPEDPTHPAEWGTALTSVALALPSVQAVTWESWRESAPPSFSSCGKESSAGSSFLGLLDGQNQPHPLWQRWCQLRSRYLQ